jgi:hypothetical protein
MRAIIVTIQFLRAQSVIGLSSKNSRLTKPVQL